MKKFYLLIALITTTAFAFGQMIPANHGGKIYNEKIVKNQNINKAVNQFYIDYDAAEESLYGAAYSRYYWETNNAFDATPPASDTAWQYLIVGFDSLYDYQTDITYNKASVTSYTIDSVFAYILHKNISGTTNRWIFSIIALDGTGYPDESNVLHKDTIETTTTLDPGYVAGDNFNSTGVFVHVLPNYTLPSGITEYGVKLEFEGPKTDSAAFLAGFVDQGACGTMTVSAMESLYAPNSYSLWTQYESYGTLPTATGGDIYYDCDGSGDWTSGDGANFIQNGNIWVHVTIDDGTSIEDKTNNNVLGNAYPNPSNDIINIPVNSDNATLTISNVLGSVVETVNINSVQTYQLEVSNLQSGVYFYTLHNANYSITKKFIVE